LRPYIEITRKNPHEKRLTRIHQSDPRHLHINSNALTLWSNDDDQDDHLLRRIRDGVLGLCRSTPASRANAQLKKFTTPHPNASAAASQIQEFKRDTTMTKIYSLTAAFVLFAPVAIAALMQAAQIVA